MGSRLQPAATWNGRLGAGDARARWPAGLAGTTPITAISRPEERDRSALMLPSQPSRVSVVSCPPVVERERRSSAVTRWRRASGGCVPRWERTCLPGEPRGLADRRKLVAKRKALRNAFASLKLSERRRQAPEFRKRLRKICTSSREFQGAWDSAFAPLLETRPITASPGRTPPGERERSPGPPAGPRAQQNRRDRGRAARALDVKLRAARAEGAIDVGRLLSELNGDRHFVAAFGGRVSERQMRDGLAKLGRYRLRENPRDSPIP